MDNTEEKALNENVGEDTNVSTTPVEEPKTPTEEPEAQPDTEPAGEEEGEVEGTKEEKAPKKGAEVRIRELNAKAKEAENRANSLQAKIEELTAGVSAPGPQGPYIPQIQPGQEVTQEQYRANVMQSADALVQLRLKQQEIINNVNSEAEAVTTEYTELDPDNKDAFNKELSDAITKATYSFVQANLSRLKKGDVKKFVRDLIKPYKSSLSKEVAREAETITKQVSQTALRPTPSAKQDKKFEELSLKEMEQRIGTVS